MNSQNKPITQVESFVYYLQNMDIEMISNLLDEKRTYQRVSKTEFIHRLGLAIDEFRKLGDTYLNKISGRCDSSLCNYKCNGFAFIGNNSNKHLDLVFEQDEDGNILDMQECVFFLCVVQKKRTDCLTRVKIDIG
ncbi:MAG: hypothetical protein FGM46_04120 [Ferruginibacter sp.]|nr:hypothetical protein [Ferruginibacter sp.]